MNIGKQTPGLLLVALTAFLVGCARFEPERLSPAQSTTNFNARTLTDPGLKRFIEGNLKHRLKVWPLESWDFPALTFVARYFHPNLDAARTPERVTKAGTITAGRPRKSASAEHLAQSGRLQMATVAWEVRANVRTNLLHYVTARRRLELLSGLSEFQYEIIRRGRNRQMHSYMSWEELSAVHTQFANTLIARLDTLEQVMQSRERLSEALGLPVRALIYVEVTYDFSRGASKEFAAVDLRRLALQNRSDVLSGLADYAAADTALRVEIAKDYPSLPINARYQWDCDKNRWTIGPKPEFSAPNQNSRPVAEVEAHRAATAARFLTFQAEAIAEVDRNARAHRAARKHLADRVARLSALRRQRDAVATQVKDGAKTETELLMLEARLAAARLNVFDAQVQFQHALGSLEDAMQQPAELFGVGHSKSEVVSTHE